MKYSLIEEPKPYLPFRMLSRKEARLYFSWFMEQIPKRLQALEIALQSSDEEKYRFWEADRSPTSLALFEDWFFEHLSSEKPSAEDKLAGIDELHQTKPQYRITYIIPVSCFR